MHLQHHLGQSVTGKYFYNMGESDTLGFNLLVNVPIDSTLSCVCVIDTVMICLMNVRLFRFDQKSARFFESICLSQVSLEKN